MNDSLLCRPMLKHDLPDVLGIERRTQLVQCDQWIDYDFRWCLNDPSYKCLIVCMSDYAPLGFAILELEPGRVLVRNCAYLGLEAGRTLQARVERMAARGGRELVKA